MVKDRGTSFPTSVEPKSLSQIGESPRGACRWLLNDESREQPSLTTFLRRNLAYTCRLLDEILRIMFATTFAGQCLPMVSREGGQCQCRSTKRGARTGPLVFSVRCSTN